MVVEFNLAACIMHSGSLSHYHGFMGHLNRTEPPFMSLVTSVFFILQQVKISAMRGAYCVESNLSINYSINA